MNIIALSNLFAGFLAGISPPNHKSKYKYIRKNKGERREKKRKKVGK
jgi:hypothetical protein